jgi:NADH-quinone oxidoreductase subunit G
VGAVLRSLAPAGQEGDVGAVADLLRSPGAVVLAGERLAESPGALSGVAALVDATGARLGWVPRRAGERGAVEAGALPGLLPGGRPVDDAGARVDAATVWGVPSLPSAAGRDTAAMIQAAASGDLDALVVGGVDLGDLADPAAADAALAAVGFVVSLELRHSSVTAHADVVLPVAPVAEKSGTFLDWEGRARPFPQVLHHTFARSDAVVLNELADAIGVDLGLHDVAAVRAELSELEPWGGARTPAPAVEASAPVAGSGQILLATWSTLLDAGRLQDGEPHLAGTAKPAVALVSEATARAAGLAAGDRVLVRSESGELSLTLAVDDLPDGVVWLPTNAVGCAVRRGLRAGAGASVTLGGAS